jgi:hypothetical protein
LAPEHFTPKLRALFGQLDQALQISGLFWALAAPVMDRLAQQQQIYAAAGLNLLGCLVSQSQGAVNGSQGFCISKNSQALAGRRQVVENGLDWQPSLVVVAGELAGQPGLLRGVQALQHFGGAPVRTPALGW